MSGKMALVVFDRCEPGHCADGVCIAAKACERKVLRQEDVYEPPMACSSVCRGCGDCVKACPLNAIEIRNV